MIADVHNEPALPAKDQIRDYKTRMKNYVSKYHAKLVQRIISDSSKKGAIVMEVRQSDRLGTCLRLDNIRCATCTYNCVYCEHGGPEVISTVRRECLSPYELYLVVQNMLESLKAVGIDIDYINIHPNSEPTIDIALWREIGLLRDLGIKIAVFTNASLLWNPLVQDSLHCADYVSAKVDTVHDHLWHTINRPHCCLSLDRIMGGITDFSHSYAGIFTTETRLVKGLNDSISELEALGKFLRSLKRAHSYFMTPDRVVDPMHADVPEPAFMEEATDYIIQHIPSSEVVVYAAGTV